MGYIARLSSGLTAFGCAGFLIGAIMSNNGTAVVADTSNAISDSGMLDASELASSNDNRIDSIITSAIKRVEAIEGGGEAKFADPNADGEEIKSFKAKRVKTVSITPETVDRILGSSDKPKKQISKKTKKKVAVVKKTAKKTKTKSSGKIYKVKPGDNLYRIGVNHGLSLSKIAKLNGIGKPYTVKVGQRIIVR